VRVASAWVLVVGLFLAEWYAAYAGKRALERATKPLATLSVLALGLSLGVPDRPWGWAIIVGVLLGLLGDVLLLGDSEPAFLGGLGSFLLGHVSYLLAFSMMGLAVSPWLGLAAVVLLACLWWSRDLLPRVVREAGASLAVPVALYTLVLAAACVVGALTGRWAIALGTAAFLVSDTILGVDRFVRPVRQGHLLVMVTYLLAQLGIVVGAALA
jgi:uncharacterized membrane protein YhhN